MTISQSLESTFNALQEGVLIADKNGWVLFCNKAYQLFSGDMRHQNINNYNPKASILNVMKTGKPLFSELRYKNNEEYFCNIYPIYEDGVVAGGISVLTFLREATYLSNKLKEINEERQFLKKRILANNGTRYTFDNIIAESEPSIKILQTAKKIAPSDINVLIEGESGCGKEVYHNRYIMRALVENIHSLRLTVRH